ncbi:DUF3810 domain-containing protein [Pleomorphovibrio marinus]|uniref:DUF3810 domain-containing protein n=1 Tax=Pleomorphovibrio marinus TaxID=2164132 RepID=UPI000E0A9FCB|nr:DUF3810 domain-containing protein [Pleomorphovibrio marinus]
MWKGNWTWAFLGLAALLLRWLARLNPEITEAYYSRTFFPVIRNVIDATLAKLPFPTVYLFLFSVLAVFVLCLNRLANLPDIRNKAVFALRNCLNGLGLLVFFFLILWGYNYQRVPVYEQVGIFPEPLGEEKLVEEIEFTLQQLTQLRPIIKRDTFPIEDILPYPDLERFVREEMGSNLLILGLNHTGSPRAREFFPSGFMRRMGIYGIYFPFTGESYIDPSLHPLEKPFTVAHEMAHSYGITDEGEANFIAWIICTNSSSTLLQYTGHLRLFRYQLNDLYRINENSYLAFVENIPPGIRNDLLSIRENVLSIRPLFLELTKRSNDLYLKTQGVKSGVKSYAELPMLVYAWKNLLK